MSSKLWNTFTRIGRIRLGKAREAIHLLGEIIESLTAEQKAQLMMMATPEQIEKGMKLYGIWSEFWVITEEEKKDE